jgi:hypothetical protein
MPAAHPASALFPLPREERSALKEKQEAARQMPKVMNDLIYAIANGVDRELFSNSDKPIPPGRPLSPKQAAMALLSRSICIKQPIWSGNR